MYGGLRENIPITLFSLKTTQIGVLIIFMKYFKNELLRILKSKAFIFPIILSLCMFVGSFLVTKDDIISYGGYSLFYSTMFMGYLPLLPSFAPLLAALPASNSFIQDKQHHFLWGIFNRTTSQQYWIVKFFSVGLAGALALILPLTIWLIINLIFFGNVHPVDSAGLALSGPFWNLIVTKQDFWYCLINILHCGLFGFIYANIGLLASLFIQKSYAAIGLPFIIYTLPSFIFPYLGLDVLEPVDTFLLNGNGNSTYGTVYGELSLVLIIIVILYIWRTRRSHKWIF